jgi:hypothetical protein
MNETQHEHRSVHHHDSGNGHESASEITFSHSHDDGHMPHHHLLDEIKELVTYHQPKNDPLVKRSGIWWGNTESKDS